jgi:hypothetical protein
MILVYIVMLISLITIIGVFVWFALQDQHIVCNSNGCTGDCCQGRNCTCDINQERLRLDDEFNNANWPFPVNRP